MTWVGQSGISDLVQSIRTVGNQFSEEDLLVGVEGVDDQIQQLGDLGLRQHDQPQHGTQSVNSTYLETERLGGSRHFELIRILSDLRLVSCRPRSLLESDSHE